MKDALDLRLAEQCRGIVLHEDNIWNFKDYIYFACHDGYELYDPAKGMDLISMSMVQNGTKISLIRLDYMINNNYIFT